MIRELLTIYEEGRINPGSPECMFAETLIFNEGWMLRAAMRAWLEGRGRSGLGFLPFPPGVVAYSEAQLFTPFPRRPKGDRLGEGNTHVDGIVGQFTIAGSKSGITLDAECRYLAVFEAKMYSGLSRGVANVRDYDQVSRTAACMIHGMLEAGAAEDCAAVHCAAVHCAAPGGALSGG